MTQYKQTFSVQKISPLAQEVKKTLFFCFFFLFHFFFLLSFSIKMRRKENERKWNDISDEKQMKSKNYLINVMESFFYFIHSLL